MIMGENNYKVLITTSGLGQRLGNLTKYTNKALVRVGKKPAISYIIESYPKNTSFVITIGHYGNQIKDFIGLAYPDRSFEFVEVDKLSGQGSSLGYSMLCAKDKLKSPFIYHACDTIVTENIPSPNKNWIGGYKGEDSSQYASWKILDGEVFSFNDKGALDFDYIHIGLVGIKEYETFWSFLESLYQKNPNDEDLNDCKVVVGMLDQQEDFELKEFSTWYDTGNTMALHSARENIADHFENLDKIGESLFIFDDFVIKFFFDGKIVKNRVARAKNLNGLVPEIEGEKGNFYRYKYTNGNLYSEVVNPSDFLRFLTWSEENLWKSVDEVNEVDFKKACMDFYETKTRKRVKEFLDSNFVKDENQVVNGDMVPTIEELLDLVDFEKLSDTEQFQFHGDFILDNVLQTPSGEYCLLDWRQDFGGLLISGDKYYDFAKLNHNLVVNHHIVSENLFTIKVGDSGIRCDILRKHELVKCQETLFEFLDEHGYDVGRVKLLTSLIWLNMSPLHHHPFSLFLFYFGKWNLWQTIQENN